MNKHLMFFHVWKAIDHTIILALRLFRYNFLLLTDAYLPHIVLDCKVIDPQATISSIYFFLELKGKNLHFNLFPHHLLAKQMFLPWSRASDYQAQIKCCSFTHTHLQTKGFTLKTSTSIFSCFVYRPST